MSFTDERDLMLFRARLASAGCPPAYQQVPASMHLPPELEGWHGDPPFLTIIGAPGSGKTWIATSIFGGFRMAGSLGLWVDMAEAIERMREEITATGKTLAAMMAVPLLLLDDVLAEGETEFARGKRSLLLRHRWNHQRVTIITTNSSDSDGNPSLVGLEAVEPRLASRLADGLVVKLAGGDRRLAAKAALP